MPGVTIARCRFLHQGWKGRRSRSRSDGSEANPETARPDAKMVIQGGVKKRPECPLEAKKIIQVGNSVQPPKTPGNAISGAGQAMPPPTAKAGAGGYSRR